MLSAPRLAACCASLVLLLVLMARVVPNENDSKQAKGAAITVTAADGILLAGSAPGAMPMPKLGFGTCCRRSAKGQPLIDSTLEYLSRGGRLIDTAQMYGNQRDLAVAIQQSGVPRQETWITSKVKTVDGGLSRSDVSDQVDKILSELGVTYVDLVLLHHAKNNDDAARVEQWRGLLDAKDAGKIRHAGVSNYNRLQLEGLESETGVLPAVDQLEYHPWVDDATHELVGWCRDRGIAVTAYGSLGSSGASGGRSDGAGGVATVAERHGVSAASVLLRWALGRGCAVIPGATSAEHIEENLHPADFELSKEDEEDIRGAKLPDGWRLWKNMVSSR